MALSNMLAKAGTPPDSVRTDATVTLRPVDGTPTITKIALVTIGRVPGIDEAAFIEHANAAKAGCPGEPTLASVPEITLEASLDLSNGSGPVRGPADALGHHFLQQRGQVLSEAAPSAHTPVSSTSAEATSDVLVADP